MTSHFIGLNSFNLYEDPKFIEVEEKEFCYETIFAIDRSIRTTAQKYPKANWNQIKAGLVQAGYHFVSDTNGSVFWHARQWDEHLVSTSKSFFVTFPDSASHEIAGEIFLATSYASLFAIVSTEHLHGGSLLLINSSHEVVYPDDLVWETPECENQIGLGSVVLIESQFSTPQEIDLARQELTLSGFEVYQHCLESP